MVKLILCGFTIILEGFLKMIIPKGFIKVILKVIILK